ncbi:hemerythrin domain-containing protein [Flavobacterium sp. Sr18]|uniref:hemerythrin domain-containing protein n=1 Tax=Flavobacterium sp. Sr18 TaxID=935222 RepID=UPI0013E5222A|nr:hemerythrin domain-containing protein [Flavobacterium sp. Sr18]QIH40140.1 hemerythrin domain-containing protein [Flavobacterium sp. Sr18]
MISNKPLKRAPELQPLSHDHHHGLQLCWKIRTGFSKQIEPNRIKKYTDWFFKTHLKPHFELEEKHVFPILGAENELVKKALAEHRRLKRLFKQTTDLEKSLGLIEEELDAHIRFEERILFVEIQKIATQDQLAKIKEIHTEESFTEKDDDPFWI